MPRVDRYVLIAVCSLLVPALLAVLVLPTPSSDTREAFTWGHFFSLETVKHPPMMQWVAGLTARLFGPTAFWAIIVTQVLNAIASLYVYGVFRLIVDRDRARLFALLFATNFYLTAGALPFALNADVLQIVSWAAIVFHAIRAAEGNAWGHWLALALWAAAAVYTKYTVLVLFGSLGAASVFVPQYRRIWLNPRLYVCVILGVLTAAPLIHAIATRTDSVGHAEGLLAWDAPAGWRLYNLWQMALGLILYLAPGWIILAAGFLRRDCRWAGADAGPQPTLRFVQIANAVSFGTLALLVLVGGLSFSSRYVAPFLILFALAACPLIEFDRTRWAGIESRTLRTLTVTASVMLLAGGLIYSLFANHDVMQEPSFEAAAAIRADWSTHYPCGPAYMLGDIGSANGMALTGAPLPVGIPMDILRQVSWFDPALLQSKGAIVIYRDAINWAEVASALPSVGPRDTRSITLPMLRTRTTAAYTYRYFFLPPASCLAPAG